MRISALIFHPQQIGKVSRHQLCLFLFIFFVTLPLGPLPLCSEITLEQGEKTGHSRTNPSQGYEEIINNKNHHLKQKYSML